MMFRRCQRHIGLDVGNSATKTVEISVERSRMEIISYGTLETQAEGILNEAELYRSVSDWLSRQESAQCPLAVALPQYLATTMVRDFPEAHGSALEAMVRYETSQVEGLSDEALVHDFHSLPCGAGRQNPVLIGLARETLVRERLKPYAKVGLETGILCPAGIALANAFLVLHPEKAADKSPLLLLDLGAENSTLVVLSGGQPVYIGSLNFSGQKLSGALQAEAEGRRRCRELAEVDLLEEIGHSPLLAAAVSLENEIHDSLEAWRAQEEAVAGAVVSEVYLCGGVSRTGGLRVWLEERLETPVELFGPELAGKLEPEYAVAFGLACQAAGLAAVPLNLLPADYRARQLRARSWPMLAAALGIFILSVFTVEAHWWLKNRKALSQAEARKQNLSECARLAGDLEALQGARRDLEVRLIPLVEAGNLSLRIAGAVSALGTACSENDWFVYLADEASYQKARYQHGEPIRRGEFLENPAGNGDATGTEEFPCRLQPRELVLNTSFIAAGYTRQLPAQPLLPIRTLAGKLEEAGMFSGVDILAEVERAGRVDIFQPWFPCLRRMSGQYKAFSFRLPYSRPDVHTENLPAPSKGRGK